VAQLDIEWADKLYFLTQLALCAGFTSAVSIHNEACRVRGKCRRHCHAADVRLSVHPAHVESDTRTAQQLW